MKKLHKVLSIYLCAALFLPLSAWAGAESGLYLGGGVGDTNIKGNQGGDDFDFDSTGYKLVMGYNFGVVPLVDLAVEGAYVDLGEESSGGVSVEQTSWNAFGLAGLSFGPLGIFAKTGLAAWDAETSVGGISSSDSGTDPVYGIGARLQFGSFQARLEFERYDQSDFDDVKMSSVSFLYTF